MTDYDWKRDLVRRSCRIEYNGHLLFEAKSIDDAESAVQWLKAQAAHIERLEAERDDYREKYRYEREVWDFDRTLADCRDENAKLRTALEAADALAEIVEEETGIKEMVGERIPLHHSQCLENWQSARKAVDE